MRIVIDARKIGDYGIGTYIREIGATCAELAPEHTFIFLAKANATGPHETDSAALGDSISPALVGANVRWKTNRSGNYSLSELVTVSWQARKLGADVFHAPHYVYPIMLPCPGVVTIHDCIHLRFPKQLPNRGALVYARTMLRRAVRKASRVMTVSQTTRSDLVELVGADPAKIEVIPHGCDPFFLEEATAEETAAVEKRHQLHRPFLLYVGNIKPHKNLTRLMDAFGQLAADYPDLQLVLAGDEIDAHPSLERARHELGLAHRVRFLGYLPKEELRALYKLALVFVFPSLYEGFGLPPLEAMASGTPVVAGRSSALPEVIDDNGLLVNPYRVDAIAEAIRRLVENDELRRALGARGRERARQFSWKRAARRVLEVYSQVASS